MLLFCRSYTAVLPFNWRLFFSSMVVEVAVYCLVTLKNSIDWLIDIL